MNWQFYIKSYQEYLAIERAMSVNTIANYTFDIQKLQTYLDEFHNNISPEKIDTDTIQEFVYHISKEVNTRSQSRIISGLKSFFQYLIFEDYRTTNPTDLLETPKIGRKLPETLAIEEIDALISAIDLSSPEGERNRTILETLYACGLRVSELVTLKISDLFFEEGFIKISGKGNKQRFDFDLLYEIPKFYDQNNALTKIKEILTKNKKDHPLTKISYFYALLTFFNLRYFFGAFLWGMVFVSQLVFPISMKLYLDWLIDSS